MEKLNLFQKINVIMTEVEAIQKEDKKVNGQYTFVSHDAVARALHLPMAKHGVVMMPSVVEMTQDGNRTVAKIDVTFVNSDSPEEKFVVTYYGYGIDTQDKGPGKAISYAVKYALLKTFCLETGDDIEKDNIDYKPEKKKPKEKEESELSKFELEEFMDSWGDEKESREIKREFFTHIKNSKNLKTWRETVDIVKQNEKEVKNFFVRWKLQKAA